MKFISALTLGLAALAVFAQSPNALPRFVAADVHASPALPVGALPPQLRVVPVYADRYELDNATLPDMIGIAWGFETDKVVGGPTWLDMDRFDIRAKLPGDTSADDQKRMLQALLEDRFKLAVHKDTKPVPGYTLTATARKPALQRATGSEKSGCVSANTNGPFTTLTYNCRNITMGAFTEGLHDMTGISLLLGAGPIVDATGLKGAWNFDLKWTQDYFHLFNGTNARVTIIDALDQQLGLKLEARPVPVPALVVDRVNRTPTANAADLARVMPPIPPLTRFDVASVKPTNPGSSQSSVRIQPGGRFVVEGLNMTGLFQLAFVGRTAENMPKWADSDRFDIVAKAPSGTAPLDRTTLGLPLQNLLKDRFKLTSHTEQRPAAAYILRAVKPKLKKADPASRSFCKRDMPLSGSQGGEWSIRFVCQNITMAQFAEWLAHNGIGLVSTTVSDSTGLNGAWDFTLIYGMAPLTQHPADAASPSDITADPTSGYTIFEAMEKQLGLRLETTKGLRPVMVIDHIDEKPTGQ